MDGWRGGWRRGIEELGGAIVVVIHGDAVFWMSVDG